MKKRHPQIGSPINIIYAKEAFASEQTTVANHIGNYVILGNGLRFHVLDDATGENMWMLHEQSINITAAS